MIIGRKEETAKLKEPMTLTIQSLWLCMGGAESVKPT